MPKPVKCPNCGSDGIAAKEGSEAFLKDFVINLVIQRPVWSCQCFECHATWQMPREEEKNASQAGKEANTKG